MKIKIIKKILVGLIATSTIWTASGVVLANPKKYLCSCQNIYDLEGLCGSGKFGHESDEKKDEQKTYVNPQNKNQISEFVFLLNKPVWDEFDAEDFLDMCLDFAYDDMLEECSLKQKLKVTNMLARRSFLKECQEQIAEIFLNFSCYDFFKEYSLDQRIDITDVLLECLGQDAAKEYVVEAFSNLSYYNFFKEYHVDQKVKIAKNLIICLSEKEFDSDIIEHLNKFLNDPKIFEKLDQNEKDLCSKILKKL